MARNMDAGQLEYWTDKLKLRRQDADAIAQGVVLARKVLVRLAGREMSRPELYELLGRLPREGNLRAYELAESGCERQALKLYLNELRFVELDIGGGDLLAMGLQESPELGDVLWQLKLMKLEGKVEGREDELKAARRLVDRMKKAGTAGLGSSC